MIEKLGQDHFLIKELVESFLDDWKKKSGQRDHSKRNYFYMSDVAKCDRATFYDFVCPEKKRPITAKALMMFAAGNLIHDDLQDRARRRGLVDSPRDLEYGLEDWAHKASGRLDFITPVYRFIETEKGIAVVEIKTKNSYNFGIEEPTQEEVDQVLWYIDRLKAHEAKSIKQTPVLDYGFILYVDRSMVSDPLPLCGWQVDFEQARVDAIKVRFDSLDKTILAGKVPQRPYVRDSIKCQYCRYLSPCWEGVPMPAPAILEADASIEPPEQELVESMASRLLVLEAELKERKTEYEKCESTLARYFKATGISEIPVDGKIIAYASTARAELDVAYLYAQLKAVWHEIATPQIKLIQAAIKAGKVDPEIYERSRKIEYSWNVKIRKPKGGGQ